ncbi:hypothetical protein GGTG_09982 [Gaeumannomyces tritici R3-111a-1]|uniref:Mitochondrial carrier protein n=1 Tax=Gaeumannomyces tritici (strain R3-111a-1) TaxID=644352 RepID=J3P8Z8_GAET3|nr:hypothetical protein GGTG_09982 [Gaeumannomyces tritici R3-111a-1]EJT73133.1 hypothetical protein GGTG_09982 [Gaeumannomyces tritici R3-111a-1]
MLQLTKKDTNETNLDQTRTAMSDTHAHVLMAGACAAFTIDLLVYPLDTLKTRWQSQDYIDTFKKSAGARNALKQALRGGLYQGVGSVIVATVPAAGVFFATYESVKSALPRALPEGAPKPLVHSLASGTAELASCLVLTPAEIVKQNAQMIRSQGGGSRGGGGGTSLQALRMLRTSEGGVNRRLWTGFSALAARNLPFTAMQFPMFEHVRASLWRWRDDRRRARGLAAPPSRREAGGADIGRGLMETGLVNGASAALSGSVAAVATTPIDVVKTRIMLLGGEGRAGAASGHTSSGGRGRAGGFEVAKNVYTELGVRGLFRGGLFRAGWTALGSALYLGTYEVAKLWLVGDSGR